MWFDTLLRGAEKRLSPSQHRTLLMFYIALAEMFEFFL